MSKENGSNKSLLSIIAIILALSTVCTVFLQIYLANQQTTKLETTLFSILQFVFSLGFAWILSRVEAKREFVQSQRQFAIAAYRRINEIDEGVEHVISRAKSQMKSSSNETARELDVIVAIATGIRTSIKSSIADWGDVIGEEIITMNKIEQITDDQQRAISHAEIEEVPTASECKTNESITDNENYKNIELLSKLRDSLPYSLQIITQTGSKTKSLKSIISNLEIEMLSNGYIDLKGFWDSDFKKDIWTFNVGDRLRICIGASGVRDNILMAKDDVGNSVGVITNQSGASYDLFKRAVMKFMNKDEFNVEIVSIDEKESKGSRHYFRVRAYEKERNIASEE